MLKANDFEIVFNPQINNYLWVRFKDKPGVIVIQAGDEGFTVDIWSDEEEVDDSTATAWATYEELRPEDVSQGS